MSSRNSAAPILTAGLLVVGGLGVPAVSNAESVEPSVRKCGTIAHETGHRGRGPRVYLPVAPSYRYYDYPYYYSRGHYPTHISPGFVYFGYPFSYYRSFYSACRRGPGSPGRKRA
jgi:hypothetical protein